MSRFDSWTLDRLLRTGGAFLGGIVGTVVFTLVLLWVLQPLQAPIYDGLYLLTGPWTATITATILSFVLASLVAISIPTVLVIYRRGHADQLPTLGAGLLVWIVATALAVLLTAVLGMISILVAVIIASLFIALVPLTLRYLDLWPDGAVVFAGGVPVLILSMLLLGFGLGWGGGYDIVATEVPASSVDGGAVANFADAPTLRDDMLTPDDDTVYAACEIEGGQRTCRLSLRGYEHEARATKFLARHGVRCPFRNARGAAGSDGEQSFIAKDNGTYYRISCIAYGD